VARKDQNWERRNPEKSCALKGALISKNLLYGLLIRHPFGVQVVLTVLTGGLRFATTTGYLLPTLRVASAPPVLYSSTPNRFGSEIQSLIFATFLRRLRPL